MWGVEISGVWWIFSQCKSFCAILNGTFCFHNHFFLLYRICLWNHLSLFSICLLSHVLFSHIQNGKHWWQWEKLRKIVYLTSRCLRSAKIVCTLCALCALCALCTLFLIKRLRICSYSVWAVCVLVTVLISPSINICLFNSLKMCCLKQINVRYV